MAKKKAAAEAAPEVTATPTPEVVAPEPVAPKVEREKANGITRPLPDSITGRLWAIADEISRDLGRPAPRKAVVERFRAELGDRANDATAHTQYARWVQFNDASDALKEARNSSNAERAKAKEEAKAKREAEREAKREEKARLKREAEEAKAAEKAAKEAEKAAKVEPAPVPTPEVAAPTA